MVKVKIIRHSERFDFSHPFYWLFCFGHYWSDSPLTSNGYTIANDKGKQMTKSDFNPKYIYTSPYNRTMATATEIKNSFPESQIIIEPLLSEYQPYFKHKINLYPKGIPTKYEGKDTEFNYPETYEKFSERIVFILSQLIVKNDSDFIIMTHGEVLKVYFSYLQQKFPELILDIKDAPYLTILSFEYDSNSKKILGSSVKIE